MRRVLAGLAVVAVTLLGRGGRPATEVVPVAVEVQRCARPAPDRGVGTVVGPGLVLTARHVVDGALRRLEVDGAPARVVVDDARTDLALLEVDGVARTVPAFGRAAAGDAVVVLGPAGPVAAVVERTTTVRVHDTTDDVVHQRAALVLRLDADPGWSGSPVVAAGGRVVGVVVLADRSGRAAYATAGEEVDGLVSAVRRSGVLRSACG